MCKGSEQAIMTIFKTGNGFLNAFLPVQPAIEWPTDVYSNAITITIVVALLWAQLVYLARKGLKES